MKTLLDLLYPVHVIYKCSPYHIITQAQTGALTPTTSGARKVALQKSSSVSRHDSGVKSETKKVITSKPAQESGTGYDPKLVEMIESVIVDRSPSVKWEDIG